MKGVILAGGKGTRLRPLTCHTPKPLVHIMNRPIMEYCINWLKSYGITEIAVTVHYLSEKVINYFGDGSEWGVKLYYFKENIQLGTAGAIKNVISFLDETFIVMSADAFTDADITNALQFHKERNSLLTILTKDIEDPREFGIILTKESGKITGFLEKPAEQDIFSHCVNTGIYIMEPDLVETIPAIIPFDFSQDLFPLMIKKNAELYACPLEGYWRDIGKVDQYFQAHIDFLDHKVNVSVNADESLPNIWIGKHTFIDPSVQLEAPVYIGENCVIEEGVHLSAYTVIGNDSIIGANTKLKGSIIWNNVRIGEEADLCGTLIASRSFIGNQVSLLENSVIGHGCILETNCHVKNNVKICPNNRIPSYSYIQSSIALENSQNEFIVKGGLHQGNQLKLVTSKYIKRLVHAFCANIDLNKQVLITTDGHQLSTKYAQLFSESIHHAGVSTTILHPTPPTLFKSLIEHSTAFGGIMFRNISSEKNSVLLIRLINADGTDYSTEAIQQLELIVNDDSLLNNVFEQKVKTDIATSINLTNQQHIANFEQKIIP